MPFGLTTVLTTVFQASVKDVLIGMLNHFVFVYLDYIYIFFMSRGEHIHNVQTVLQCLLKNSLFLKVEKCKFHVRSVSFLGYIVSQGNIQMDPAKVSAGTSWPTPDSHTQLQRFLGFANFYHDSSGTTAQLPPLAQASHPPSWPSTGLHPLRGFRDPQGPVHLSLHPPGSRS